MATSSSSSVTISASVLPRSVTSRSCSLISRPMRACLRRRNIRRRCRCHCGHLRRRVRPALVRFQDPRAHHRVRVFPHRGLEVCPAARGMSSVVKPQFRLRASLAVGRVAVALRFRVPADLDLPPLRVIRVSALSRCRLQRAAFPARPSAPPRSSADSKASRLVPSGCFAGSRHQDVPLKTLNLSWSTRSSPVRSVIALDDLLVDADVVRRSALHEP